jgi:hypothetical protein
MYSDVTRKTATQILRSKFKTAGNKGKNKSNSIYEETEGSPNSEYAS